jgi:hypothetical protein
MFGAEVRQLHRRQPPEIQHHSRLAQFYNTTHCFEPVAPSPHASHSLPPIVSSQLPKCSGRRTTTPHQRIHHHVSTPSQRSIRLSTTLLPFYSLEGYIRGPNKSSNATIPVGCGASRALETFEVNAAAYISYGFFYVSNGISLHVLGVHMTIDRLLIIAVHHPIPQHVSTVPQLRSPPPPQPPSQPQSGYGYGQQGGGMPQQQGGGYNMHPAFGGFMNDPTAQLGFQMGKTAMDAGQQYMEQNVRVLHDSTSVPSGILMFRSWVDSSPSPP